MGCKVVPSQIEFPDGNESTYFFGQALAQDLVLADITSVEDEQKILEPLVWRILQNIEQRMLQLRGA